MKFLADMGISMRTVERLREQGHDAVHLSEEKLPRLTDDKILEKAHMEQRILLTMDLDFGYLLAVSGGRLPSVIIFRLSDERSENITERLAEVLTQRSEDLEAGAILSVSDTAIRVRRLPI